MNAKTKTTITIMLGIVLVIWGGLLAWNHFHKNMLVDNKNKSPGVNTVNFGPPTSTEKQAGNQVKQQNIQNLNNSGNTSSPANNSASSTTVTISRLSQSSAGQLVSLRTILNNYINNGQCIATFSMSGQTTITKTASIANGPTYYSCEPIDVSANEFSVSGAWQVAVYVQLNGITISNKAPGTVTVQK